MNFAAGKTTLNSAKVATVVRRLFADRLGRLVLALPHQEQGDAGSEHVGEVIVRQKRISVDLVEQRLVLLCPPGRQLARTRGIAD